MDLTQDFIASLTVDENQLITGVSDALSVGKTQVSAVIELFSEGCTIPFISRYRKEKTGGLDEVQVRDINHKYNSVKNLETRRLEIIRLIFEQGKLTDSLYNNIKNAATLSELEDIYAPYKRKKKTRGMLAIERGLEPLAQVMCNLGVKNAMVVHGEDGLDEISLSAPTFVCEVKDGWVRSYTITPEQFGFVQCNKIDLQGGNPSENAEILKALFQGQKSAKRDAAVLNAAAAMFITGKYDSIEAAVKIADDVIDSGKALQKLEDFIRYSNEG